MPAADLYHIYGQQTGQISYQILAAADVESKYILNAIPYLGKDEARPATQRLSESLVIKIVDPYLSKVRNITIDNFFYFDASCHTGPEKKTSLVGTLNKIRKKFGSLVKALQQSRYSSKL